MARGKRGRTAAGGCTLAPAAFFCLSRYRRPVIVTKYLFYGKFLQFAPPIFDTATMAQSTQVQREGVAQVAGRILIAWRSGESAGLIQELENARCLAAQTPPSSTLEMEKMEVLSGAVESLGRVRGQHAGAVRLLEHLAAGTPRGTGF